MEANASLAIGEVTVRWLPGGEFWLDGGALFATVAKSSWERCRPPDVANCLCICNDPLLLEVAGTRILLDSGIGQRLGPELLQAYRVTAPWRLVEGLNKLGIGREVIDHLVLSHGDFDHAGGLVMDGPGGGAQPTFPNAVIHVQHREWQDILAPHRRSAEAYDATALSHILPERLHLVDGDTTIAPGIKLRLSGGHTRGHQVVEIESGGDIGFYLGDLLPTHHHGNPLWHLAYDNFPLTVVDSKIEYLERYEHKRPWFLLYHDPYVRACRLDKQGGVRETWPLPLDKISGEAPGKAVGGLGKTSELKKDTGR